MWRTMAGTGAPVIRTLDYRGARLSVFANEDVGWRLLTTKEYEPKEMAALESLIREDDLCVDAGAHVGIFAIAMARRARRGRVIAVEPLEEHRQLLERNVAQNGLNNVEVVSQVLAHAAGEVDFSVSHDGSFSSMRPTGRRSERERRRLRATTLDALLAARAERVGVVKVDVEGAELHLLKGARNLLGDASRRPRALLVELSRKNEAAYGYGPEQLVSYLGRFGYRPWSITRRGVRAGWPKRGASESVLFVHAAEQSPTR